jgi:hypothetical protein
LRLLLPRPRKGIQNSCFNLRCNGEVCVAPFSHSARLVFGVQTGLTGILNPAQPSHHQRYTSPSAFRRFFLFLEVSPMSTWVTRRTSDPHLWSEFRVLAEFVAGLRLSRIAACRSRSRTSSFRERSLTSPLMRSCFRTTSEKWAISLAKHAGYRRNRPWSLWMGWSDFFSRLCWGIRCFYALLRIRRSSCRSLGSL